MFIWYLYEAGHHLVPVWDLWGAQQVSGDESSRVGDPWIQPVEPSTKSNKGWRRYAPIESHPALFREFVDLKPGHELILNFADQYGLLTDPEKGEPLGTWRAAITDMRLAVECWETAQKAGALPPRGNHDVDVRLEMAEGDTDKTVILADAKYSPGSFGAASPVNPTADVDLLGQPSQKTGRRVFISHGFSDRHDVLEFLASKINRNISHARPVFFPTNFDAPVDGLTLRLMPTTLLEAMWLQFGQAVESNKAFRKCRHCGTWFDLSPKAARIDKVFCTEACKARAYRRRLAKKERGAPDQLREEKEAST
jgi:hypothetical protein